MVNLNFKMSAQDVRPPFLHSYFDIVSTINNISFSYIDRDKFFSDNALLR